MIDYSIWDMLDTFTPECAALLWLEIEPRDDCLEDIKVQLIISILSKAISNNELPHEIHRVRKEYNRSSFEREMDNYASMGKEVIPYEITVLLERDHLKNWAENKGYKPKFLFPEMRKKDEPEREAEGADQAIYDLSNAKPAYLDKNHPMFRRELSIAIEAWEQVLSSNPPRQKTGSRKKLIISWLEKHHKDLSGEAIKRISIMLNPDENGGAPSTD